MDTSTQSKQQAEKAVRRSWTLAEEQTLIAALKDIVSRGLKCDNGFRTGYLRTLEQYMVLKLPGTDIKALPHINSKVHVWKKYFGTLSTMLSRSGFGWNDANNTLDILDEQVWEEYVKTDPTARSVRYKSWPFYNDWQQIYGKDRATGENAEFFADAINDLMAKEKGKEQVSIGDDYVPQMDPSDADNYSQYKSFSRVDEATSSKQKPKSSKKRARVDVVDSSYVEMTSTFFQNIEHQMGELVSRMGFEKDVSTARKQVFDALENIPNISFEERLKVTSRICDSSKDLDIFFGMTEENKTNMVNLILQGRY